MMRSVYRPVLSKTQKSLVTIHSGKYPIVDPDTEKEYIRLDEPTHGLIVEHVGTHVDGQTSCWHVLIDNSVLLVWDDSMEKE
jgi:hypothetical protein